MSTLGIIGIVAGAIVFVLVVWFIVLFVQSVREAQR